MEITFKAENSNFTASIIQTLRKYSTESISELKQKLLKKLPLLYLNPDDYVTLEDAEVKTFEIIDDLEKSGIQLSIFIVYNNERISSKEDLRNYFESWKGTRDDIERTSEMELTEIVVAVNKAQNSNYNYPIILEDELKVYYLLDYAQELLDFMENTKNDKTIEYYQRDRGEKNRQEWELTIPDKIQLLMGL